MYNYVYPFPGLSILILVSSEKFEYNELGSFQIES